MRIGVKDRERMELYVNRILMEALIYIGHVLLATFITGITLRICAHAGHVHTVTGRLSIL